MNYEKCNLHATRIYIWNSASNWYLNKKARKLVLIFEVRKAQVLNNNPK